MPPPVEQPRDVTEEQKIRTVLFEVADRLTRQIDKQAPHDAPPSGEASKAAANPT